MDVACATYSFPQRWCDSNRGDGDFLPRLSVWLADDSSGGLVVNRPVLLYWVIVLLLSPRLYIHFPCGPIDEAI